MKKTLVKMSEWLFVILFIAMTVIPIAWCFIMSISPENEMLKNTVNLFPSAPTLDNYRSLLFENTSFRTAFLKGLENSLTAVLLTEILIIPIAVCGGYALSRFRFCGRRGFRIGLLITMVIPVFATIIPIYKMFTELGFLDNMFWLCVIYVSAFLPMIIWLVSNYLASFPKEIEEAAAIDGCSPVQILLKIVLPSSLPIILAILLIVFLMTWGQFQIPLIIASSKATKPLSIVIQEFTAKDSVFYGLMAAGGIISILPPAIAAIFFRKYLVLGMSSGAVKE